jgi:hypothetical protein
MPRLLLLVVPVVVMAACVSLKSVRAEPPGPPCVAWWAQPSNTPAYVGDYLGGGCPCPRRGDGRQVQEGTWGWDWSGWCIHRKVELLWWHGRRYQGGTGAYKTDGPEPLKRLHEGAED